VNLAAGTYDYGWYNPVTGAVSSTGTVTVASGSRTFTPPFGGEAVLYLLGGSTASEKQTESLPWALSVTPNPVTDRAMVRITAFHGSAVKAALYNINGRQMEDLTRNPGRGGCSEFTWNAKRLPCGVYILKIKSGSLEISKRILISK
jgi:hypothetical protein